MVVQEAFAQISQLARRAGTNLAEFLLLGAYATWRFLRLRFFHGTMAAHWGASAIFCYSGYGQCRAAAIS